MYTRLVSNSRNDRADYILGAYMGTGGAGGISISSPETRNQGPVIGRNFFRPPVTEKN